MRLHRFYVKHPLGEEVLIEQRELVHQWSSVFRYTIGDRVLLFSLDSPAYDYEYQIVDITKSFARLICLGKKPNILPAAKRALYMSLVKKDTFETIARQATEMMITDIVPVLSARSEKKNLNIERLLAIITEASEQCGRGDIPVLHDIMTFKDASLLAHSGHVVFDVRGSHATTSTPVGVWIGPEGGWTEEELAILKEVGADTVTLGQSILKADTAAIVGMAKIFL